MEKRRLKGHDREGRGRDPIDLLSSHGFVLSPGVGDGLV